MKIFGYVGSGLLRRAHVDRRENPAVHGHQVRREARHHLAAGGLGEFLVELGHMAMAADAVGMEALGDLREQHLLLRRPARPGHAGLGVDHDLVGVDGLGAQQWNKRELRAARVAAGIGHQLRPLDLLPIDLDQPVDRLLL